MRRIVFALTASLALLPRPAPAQAGGALGVEDVTALLEVEGALEVLPDMIRESCVSFPLDDAATRRLRGAGADDALLAVIRTACYTGTEVVVESEPVGAEVRIDDARVGTTPWTGRYLSGRNVKITANARGRALSYSSALVPGRRVRAFFAFPEELLPLPRVRTTSQVIQQLGLEAQWRPVVAEPEVGYVRTFPVIFTLGLYGGGAALGASTCSGRTEGCFLEPDIDPDTGKDLNEANRPLVGALVGLGGGIVAAWAAGKLWDSVEAGRYRRAREGHAQWKRDMETAKARWLREHPLVRQAIADDEAALARVQAQNAQIEARNAALARSSLTTEALPGPALR